MGKVRGEVGGRCKVGFRSNNNVCMQGGEGWDRQGCGCWGGWEASRRCNGRKMKWNITAKCEMEWRRGKLKWMRMAG